jgi:hypothetical protein
VTAGRGLTHGEISAHLAEVSPYCCCGLRTAGSRSQPSGQDLLSQVRGGPLVGRQRPVGCGGGAAACAALTGAAVAPDVLTCSPWRRHGPAGSAPCRSVR